MSSIVTFYSFKGGVGRTMALANVAVLLAEQKQRVLVIDWDLEAPGLERYFTQYQRGDSKRGGLIELLDAAARSTERPPWRDYVVEVSVEDRSLWLMTSGRQDVTYARRVLDFDWPLFFADQNGGAFLEWLRDEWRAAFDFVLIDSRTGFSDAGGVCLIQLPDIVVPVFTCTEQSLAGAKDVVLRAQAGRQELAYDRAPLLVLPVASRFDGRSEYELSQFWLDRFAAELADFYSPWLPRAGSSEHTVELARTFIEKTKLPYVAYFSFGEKLPVLESSKDDPEGLGFAYRSIAALLQLELRNAERVFGGDVAEDAREKPFLVPRPRDPFFVGREAELAELRTQLTERGRRGYPAIVILQGMGGIGKTAIALEYAYRFKEEYDAVCWIDPQSDNPAVRLEQVRAAARFEPSSGGEAQPSISLREPPTSLIIVDELTFPTGLAWLSPEKNEHVIVTSRVHVNASYGGTTIKVGLLTLAEAEQALLARSGRTDLAAGERDSVAAVAEALEGHPLALQIAAAKVESHGISFAAYARSLKTEYSELLSDTAEQGSRATVGATFAAALEEIGPAAADIVDLCALLFPAPIPAHVLQAGALALGQIAPADDVDFADLLQELLRSSVLQRRGDDAYTIHHLLRLFVRQRMTSATFNGTANRVVLSLATALRNRPDDWERLLPHAILAAEYISEGRANHPDDAADLLQHLGELLTIRGRYEEAEIILRENVKLARRFAFAVERQADAEATLARLCILRGDGPAARKLLDELGRLDVVDASGAAIPGLVAEAEYQSAFGSHQEAGAMLTRAREICERLLPESAETADVLDALARIDVQLERPRDAERFARRAEAIRRNTLRDDDPAIVESLFTLALVALQAGRLDEAMNKASKALNRERELVGEMHPSYAGTLRLQAEIFAAGRDYGAAEGRLKAALSIQEATLGSHHFEVVKTLERLVQLDLVQSRFVDAEILAGRTLAAAQAAYGSIGRRVAFALMLLGETLTALEDMSGAAARYNQALAILQPFDDPEADAMRAHVLARVGPVGVIDEAAVQDQHPGFYLREPGSSESPSP